MSLSTSSPATAARAPLRANGNSPPPLSADDERHYLTVVLPAVVKRTQEYLERPCRARWCCSGDQHSDHALRPAPRQGAQRATRRVMSPGSAASSTSGANHSVRTSPRSSRDARRDAPDAVNGSPQTPARRRAPRRTATSCPRLRRAASAGSARPLSARSSNLSCTQDGGAVLIGGRAPDVITTRIMITTRIARRAERGARDDDPPGELTKNDLRGGGVRAPPSGRGLSGVAHRGGPMRLPRRLRLPEGSGEATRSRAVRRVASWTRRPMNRRSASGGPVPETRNSQPRPNWCVGSTSIADMVARTRWRRSSSSTAPCPTPRQSYRRRRTPSLLRSPIGPRFGVAQARSAPGSTSAPTAAT